MRGCDAARWAMVRVRLLWRCCSPGGQDLEAAGSGRGAAAKDQSCPAKMHMHTNITDTSANGPWGE